MIKFFYKKLFRIKIKKGNYLDKGFNIKFAKSFKNLHLAVGFDDLAGTGFFSKEFIAATYDLNRLKITLGIGTGAFSEEHKYKNPIPGFENRVSYFQTSNMGKQRNSWTNSVKRLSPELYSGQKTPLFLRENVRKRSAWKPKQTTKILIVLRNVVGLSRGPLPKQA